MTVPQPVSPKVRDAAVARKFVSQNGRGYVAIGIYDEAGAGVDPDDGTLSLKVYFDDLSGTATDPRGILVLTVDLTTGIIRDDVGMFHFDVGPDWTKQKGLLNLEWGYQIGGVAFTFADFMQILEQMPYYERLQPSAKLLVEQTSWFFGDLFDSTAGGPWLQENFQTHFNYERIAQLSAQAVMKLNTLGQPLTNWGVTVNDKAVPANFQALSVWATKLEVIRHLILSYTEQPNYPNVATTYTDRRDYAERWKSVLEEEKPDFDKAVLLAKRSLLSLGRGSLLVAGGIYGGSARIFQPGMYAAMTRSMRFYPAAPSVSWGNIATGGAW
jgi:hypothetical protein